MCYCYTINDRRTEDMDECYITPAMDVYGDPESRCDTHNRVVTGDETRCEGYAG